MQAACFARETVSYVFRIDMRLSRPNEKHETEVHGEFDCPTLNNEKSDTIIIGIGSALHVESYRCLEVSFMHLSLPTVPIVRAVIIMQGYQNVRAVCSAYYRTGSRSTKSARIRTFHPPMRTFLWRRFSLAWLSIATTVKRLLVRKKKTVF